MSLCHQSCFGEMGSREGREMEPPDIGQVEGSQGSMRTSLSQWSWGSDVYVGLKKERGGIWSWKSLFLHYRPWFPGNCQGAMVRTSGHSLEGVPQQSGCHSCDQKGKERGSCCSVLRKRTSVVPPTTTCHIFTAIFSLANVMKNEFLNPKVEPPRNN